MLHLEEQYSSLLLVHEGRPGGALQHNCRRDAAVAALRPAQPNSFWQPLEMAQNVILPSSARSRACWARLRIASLPTEDLLKFAETVLTAQRSC